MCIIKYFMVKIFNGDNMINFLYLFLVYSFCGYIWEVFLYFIKTKKFVNRGELYGPWIFVYGLGGVIISYVLGGINSYFLIFIYSVILCGILEYLVSLIEEIYMRRRWWNYSNMFLNINGRVCFISLISFGFLGLFIRFIVSSFLLNLFDYTIFFKVIICLLFVLFLIDLVYSIVIPHDGENISIFID